MEHIQPCGLHHGGPLKKLVMLTLAVFLVTLIVNNIKAYGQIGRLPESPRTIVISGTGKIIATPTIAVSNIGLVTQKADVASAQAENTDRMNKMVAALQTLGIAAADVQTAQYQINPNYSYDQKTGSTITGYSVTQSLEVKIRDLTKISAVLAKAGELGANQVNGVTFTIDEPSNLQAQAREKAVADAKEKAQKLADQLGVHLGKIVGFDESAGNIPPGPIMFAKDAVGMGGGPVAAPDVQAGSLDVTSQVNVTFELE